MSRIVRWETPFVDEFYPSVLTVMYPTPGAIHARAFVSNKLNKWYSIKFGSVLVCNVMDEGCCPSRDFTDAVFDPAIEDGRFVTSFKWLDSPWLKAYEPCHDPFSKSKFSHFLIFGGDHNVEVITSNEPIIQLMEAGERVNILEGFDLPFTIPSNHAAK
jgi:hypothetical protein